MAERKRCLGYGVREGTCQNPITPESLALNAPGLWCVECEEARRKAISAQFDAISKSFGDSKGGGKR